MSVLGGRAVLQRTPPQTPILTPTGLTPRNVGPAPTFRQWMPKCHFCVRDRYFEDYVEGDVHHFGTIAVGADEIVAFANQFDPQTLHTDPEVAKSAPFGGLIASGWHTAGLMTRLFMDHYLTKVASLGSPGGAGLRCIKPVRPGDTLSVRVTVIKA